MNTINNTSDQKIISFDQWLEEYEPVINEDGSLQDADPRIAQVSKHEYDTAVKENRIWTECDSSDPNGKFGTYIISGLHVVNAFRILITEKSFTGTVLVPDEQD